MIDSDVADYDKELLVWPEEIKKEETGLNF